LEGSAEIPGRIFDRVKRKRLLKKAFFIRGDEGFASGAVGRKEPYLGRVWHHVADQGACSFAGSGREERAQEEEEKPERGFHGQGLLI
jgi:hypothetical protein